MIAYSASENFPRAGSLTPPFSTQIPQTLEQLGQYCIQGDFERFRKTLDSNSIGSGFHALDITDLSEVMVQAIKLGRTCFVKELLRQSMPVSPIYVNEAIKTNAKDVLECFIENGWDINQPMGLMHPPILSNALNDREMTTWLLDHGADPNRRCYIDFTPLSCAVEHAPLPIVNLLLSRGGDVTKGQVLHHAVARQFDTVDVLKLLIARGAPINAIMYQDHQPSWNMNFFMGETPLHKAVFLGKVDVIRYLLSEGADLNIRDVGNRTVLECADEDMRRELTESP